MSSYQSPGVYWEDVFPGEPVELSTGVPGFLGFADFPDKAKPNVAYPLTGWSEFEERFGKLLPESYLGWAVRGFFENGGRMCYVVWLNNEVSPKEALEEGLAEVASLKNLRNLVEARRLVLEDGLAALASLNTVDLVCVPDIMRYPDQAVELQRSVVAHCDRMGDRFAILDSLPGSNVDRTKRQRHELSGTNAALYYPWVKVSEGPSATGGFVPPCGHIAGVYARTDREIGVHKAPANQMLAGVVDLEFALANKDQDELNPAGVNCLRIFAGRGIRVWGARTLSGLPDWIYVNVRRIFLTAGRWIERNLSSVSFEPNNSWLWKRIRRELTTYFNGLFQQGALKGRTPEEAFYVKCDDETNPREVREAGMVITEIGLAPTVPSEYVVVRIIHGASGITIVGPSRPS